MYSRRTSSTTSTLDPMQLYRADLAHYPRLSSQEVEGLVQEIATARVNKQHDLERALKARLIEGHLGLVKATVAEYQFRFFRHLEPLDLIGEGNIGLVKAVQVYPYEAPQGHFSSFAKAYIRYAVISAFPADDTVMLTRDAYREEKRAGNLERIHQMQPVSLDRPFRDEQDGRTLHEIVTCSSILPDEQATEEKRAFLLPLLAQLTKRQREVIELFYGLSRTQTCAPTCTGIAQALRVTTGTVAYAHKRGLSKLQRLAHGLPIRTHCSDHAPASQEITDRLQQIYHQLVEEGTPITGRLLARRAQVSRGRACAYLREMTMGEQSNGTTPEERLRRAYAHLSEQGTPVRVPDLCREAGVNGQVAGAFIRAQHPHSQERLHEVYLELLQRSGSVPPLKEVVQAVFSHRNTHNPQVRAFVQELCREQSEQERLEETYKRLVERGEYPTLMQLCREAHVDGKAVGPFLRIKREQQAHVTRQAAHEQHQLISAKEF